MSTRELGIWGAAALVVGNMVGSGIFLLPASLAPFGMASLYGWIFSTTGALLLALVFARLAQRHPVSGGPYAYAHLAFGDFAGFVMAWSYWISVWCATAAIAVGFAASISALAPGFNAYALPVALAVLWLATLTNLVGVRFAGRTQIVLTALKIAPIAFVIFVGALALDAHSFTPFNPSGRGVIDLTTATAALTLWALQGLECATIPAEHVENAERSIPRATVLGVAFAAIITVAACTVVLGLVPLDTLKDSTAPFADVARRLWGEPAAQAMAGAMALSCWGALNGWVLVQGQIPLAAARDGLFPALFSRTDSNGTPRIGLVVGSVLASGLIYANFAGSLVSVFTASVLIATAAALLPYAFSAAALIRLEPLEPDRHSWHIVAAALAFVYGMWALVGAGWDALAWCAGLIVTGIPIYLYQGFGRRKPATDNRHY